MKGEHRGDRKACLPSPIMPMWTDFMLLWDDTLGGGSVGHVKVWYLICTVHRNLGPSVACNLRVSGVQIVIVLVQAPRGFITSFEHNLFDPIGK